MFYPIYPIHNFAMRISKERERREAVENNL